MNDPTPSSRESTGAPDREARLHGGMLAAVGAVVALLCGTCTESVLAPVASTLLLTPRPLNAAQTYEARWDSLTLFFIPPIGLLPTGLGLALLVRGLIVLRARPRRDGSSGRPADVAADAFTGSVVMGASGLAAYFCGGLSWIAATEAWRETSGHWEPVLWAILFVGLTALGGFGFWRGVLRFLGSTPAAAHRPGGTSASDGS